jgi:predicted GTPase
VIGVVGQTGAGKSIVINAVLEEESLVPANCVRACTGVVTEISLNNSKEPSAQYRAEIEFVDRHDWE